MRGLPFRLDRQKQAGPKTCGKCHTGKTPEAYAALPGSTNKTASTFRHSDALAKRCAECHATVMDKTQKRVPEMTSAKKDKIKEQAHAWGMDCATCHEDMDKKTRPPSHAQDWARRHGPLGSQPGNGCGVCHTAMSCKECHQVIKPESHNNLFRLKTHGVEAARDRARCQVCHTAESCDLCHENNRPVSHAANWKKDHCLNCHETPNPGTGCGVCHEVNLDNHPNPHDAGWLKTHCNNCHIGTPEFTQCTVCHEEIKSIADHPNPHEAGWQQKHCTTCHEGSPLSGKCGVCHKSNDLANHPNPHPAGWRYGHCTSCHEGTPEADQCGICHEGINTIAEHPTPYGRLAHHPLHVLP